MRCPKCNDEMPLLSKVCERCGYAVQDEVSATQMANALESILHDARALPEPTFLRSMSQLSVVMLPLITLFLLVLALISEAGIFWIAAGLFGLWSLVVIVLKIMGRLGNTASEKAFADLNNHFQTTSRIARRDFGRDPEVKALLKEVKEQIETIEGRRKAASRRNLLLWLGVLLLIVVVAALGYRSVHRAVNRTEGAESVVTLADGTTVPAGNGLWRRAIDGFDAASDDEHDHTARLKVLRTVLAAGQPAAAEDFFRRHCMGKMGDKDCAVYVVEYYLDRGDRASAEAFVKRCDLRYKSDQKKLLKLMNQ